MKEVHVTLNQFDSGLPGGLSGFREVLTPKIVKPITPDSLRDDNWSDETQARLKRWDENRRKGLHVVTKGCGDAREEIPDDENSERVQTIATGGSEIPFTTLFTSRNNQAAVDLTHHDGDTVIPEQMPEGCGGLGAKANIEKNGKKGSDIENWVDTGVSHKDPLVQATRTALGIFQISGKPVLAATQDHLTGEVHPAFAIWNLGNTTFQAINRHLRLDDLLARDNYDPKKIYQEGLPCIDFEALPPVFQEYLIKNREEIGQLYRDYPDYKKRQKIQNPGTIILTSDIRAIRAKYKENFDAPGSFFRLTFPRVKYTSGEDSMVEIAPSEMAKVFDQTEFPITRFSNATNVIIETPDIGLSVSAAAHLLERPWMEDWTKKEGAQIIAIESIGGRVIQMAQRTF